MRSRKGAISGNVPLLFLVILSTGLGMQAYFSAQTMADEVSEGMSDLGDVSNARSTNDVYYHQYIKNSGSFSIHQASYEIAQNGAGLNWDSSSVDQIEMSSVVEGLDLESNNYFQESYLSNSFEGTSCDLEATDFNIYAPNADKSLETNYISDVVANDLSSLGVDCNYQGKTVNYNVMEQYFSTKYNATDNRFYQVTDTAIRFHQNLDDELPQADQDYEGESSAVCGGPITDDEYEEAEENAVSSARSSIQGEIDDAESSTETEDGIVIDTGLKDSYGEILQYNTDTDGWTGSANYDTRTGSRCNCVDRATHDDDDGSTSDGSTDSDSDSDLGDNTGSQQPGSQDPDANDGSDDGDAFIGLFAESTSLTDFTGEAVRRLPGTGDSTTQKTSNCIEWEYNQYAEAEVNPDEVRTSTTVEDQDYRIPVESGWENLQFVVDEFRHTLESDGGDGSSTDNVMSLIQAEDSSIGFSTTDSVTAAIRTSDGSTSGDEELRNSIISASTESSSFTGAFAQSLFGKKSEEATVTRNLIQGGYTYADVGSEYLDDGSGGGGDTTDTTTDSDLGVGDYGGADTYVDDGSTDTNTDTSNDGGGDSGPECTYDGRDRQDYNYYGNSVEEFEQFQNCELTVTEFQTQTPYGDGTRVTCLPDGNCENLGDYDLIGPDPDDPQNVFTSLYDDPGIEIEEKDDRTNVGANGPYDVAKVGIGCSIENFRVVDAPSGNDAGPRVYINGQPYSVPELEEEGEWTAEECGAERPDFSTLNNLGSVATDASPFWIEKGEVITTSEDSLHFFAREKGFMNNLFFRSITNSRSESDPCASSSGGLRPLDELSQNQQIQQCDYSDVISFSSGAYRLSVCEYDEYDEMAKVVLSSGMTEDELRQVCSTPAKRPSFPEQQVQTTVENQETSDDSSQDTQTGTDNANYIAGNQQVCRYDVPDEKEADYTVSPGDGASGIQNAVDNAEPGDLIYLEGGTYEMNSKISIDNGGSADNRITLAGRPGERPVLDFSQMEAPDTDDPEFDFGGAVNIDSNYWTLRNMEIKESPGFGIRARYGEGHLIFENIESHNNVLSGILLKETSHNEIRHSKFHHNYDSPQQGEHADGVAIKQGGNPDGKNANENMVYCTDMYLNSDDGFDGYRSNDNEIWYSRSYHNGKIGMNELAEQGNGNGFKFGPAGHGGHLLVGNLAWGNERKEEGEYAKATGFDYNGADQGITLYHNTAWDNDIGFSFQEDSDLLVNNLAAGNAEESKVFSAEERNNLFKTESIDFESTNSEDPKFLMPAKGSEPVDSGETIGDIDWDVKGSAPDIGAREYQEGEIFQTSGTAGGLEHGIYFVTRDELEQFEQDWMNGEKIDLVTTTFSANIADSGTTAITFGDSDQDLREVFGQTDRRLVVAYEFAGEDRGDYAPPANGEYDQRYREFARQLVDLGMEDTVIAPNHEFNLDWSGKYPNDPANYRDGYARLVREMQSVEGAEFTFLYSPAANRLGVAPEAWPVQSEYWPDDQEPPVVAPSFYDSWNQYPEDASSLSDSELENLRRDAWNQNHKDILDMWRNFAEERNADMALREWGVGTDEWDNNAGLDNPYFIRKTFEYMREHDFRFQTYWNAGSLRGDSSTHQIYPPAELQDAGQEWKEQVLSSPDSDSSDSGTTEISGSGGVLTNRLWSLYTSGKGVETVEPGTNTLKPAVQDMLGSTATRPLTQDMIRLEPGGTYQVDNPIRLREGQDIQAEGATIIPMNDNEPVFVYDTDAKVWGGTVDLQDSGSTAFKISAERPDIQPRGVLWTRPSGPLGTFIKAESGTGATGLDISYNQRYPHGFTTPIITTEGVDKPFNFGPVDESGWSNSNEYFVRAEDYNTAVDLTGSRQGTRNRIVYDLYGGQNVQNAVRADGEGIFLNILEGKVRSTEDHNPAFDILNTRDGYANGGNTFLDYDGRTEDELGSQWNDQSGAEGNNLHPYGGVSFDRKGSGEDTRDVIVAEGDGEVTASELQDVLDNAADQSADVRIGAGDKVVSEGTEDLVIPEGVAVDARGAVIEIDGSIRFENGGLLLGGQVNKKTTGPSMVVRADGETIDQPTGPVMTYTMGFAHDDFEAADNSCDPSLLIEAVNGGEITGLVNSHYTHMCTNAVDIHADSQSSIQDNRLMLMINWGDYMLRMRGDGVIADNTIKSHMQPTRPMPISDGGTEYPSENAGWIIDGPNIENNKVEGKIWDGSKIKDESGQRPVFLIRETGGGNMYASYDSQSENYRGDQNSLQGDGSQFEQYGYADMFEMASDEYIQRTKDDRHMADEFMPAYWKPVS